MNFYNSLQIREVFHIEFVRALTRKIKPSFYVLKGGVNMRLFFGSIRYSEDIDLDVNTVSISALRDTVMKIIVSANFQNELKSFGIEKVLPPDMTKAKQTGTTQRFKIHLMTHQGEDLFTKVEFSRRGHAGNAVVQPVPEKILRQYKMSPLIVSHYDARSAIMQKIGALVNPLLLESPGSAGGGMINEVAGGRVIEGASGSCRRGATRIAVQARDVFDLYVLSTQITPDSRRRIVSDDATAKTAGENVFSVSFHQFRDSVLSYLSEEDRVAYDSPDLWDEIKLKVHGLICDSN
jgi:hypothetical protein